MVGVATCIFTVLPGESLFVSLVKLKTNVKEEPFGTREPPLGKLAGKARLQVLRLIQLVC